MSDVELFADDREEKIFPIHGGEAFLHSDHPFPALRISGIFPGGFDAILEEVVVRGYLNVVGVDDVVVDPPEMLDSLTSVDLDDRLLIIRSFILVSSSMKPKAISIAIKAWKMRMNIS